MLMDDLCAKARELGVSDAAALSADDVVVDEKLAGLCRKPRCPNYGLAPSCPPHVGGPEAMRRALAQSEGAILLRMDAATKEMYGPEAGAVMRRLHKLAAQVERAAQAAGHAASRAYAGGSCLQLFCHEHGQCAVLEGEGQCRRPDEARHSMSGYGIDVGRTAKAAGWAGLRGPAGVTPVYALVLLA